MGNTIEIPEPVRRVMLDILAGYSREPRYRYFENKQTKEMFCWTVETIGGKYACWTYKPIGSGSRSGKPKHWKAVDRVNFAKRKTAKERAWERYEKSLKGN